MKKFSKLFLAVALPVFVLIQFVPVERSNPATVSDIPAPPEVESVLRRACYDCHSNETSWPWYSRIAPVSWLVAHDVKEAREKMNLSTWSLLSESEKVEALHEIWEEVEEGEMPPWLYLLQHPEARLSEQDLSVLKQWAHADS